MLRADKIAGTSWHESVRRNPRCRKILRRRKITTTVHDITPFNLLSPKALFLLCARHTNRCMTFDVRLLRGTFRLFWLVSRRSNVSTVCQKLDSAETINGPRAAMYSHVLQCLGLSYNGTRTVSPWLSGVLVAPMTGALQGTNDVVRALSIPTFFLVYPSTHVTTTPSLPIHV